jgi:AraC-like DNA-binding protein
MMNKVIIDILGIVTAILLLIFSGFAVSYKKRKTYSHKILSAFLFSNAIYIIDFLIPEIENTFRINLTWLNGIGFTFGFLFGPLLYIYSRTLTTKDFSFKPAYLLHFLLFLFAFSFPFLDIQLRFNYIYGIMQLQITAYMVACFVVILNYRKEIKDYFSSIEKLNLDWMLFVVGAFFIMWMTDLFTFIISKLKLIDLETGIYLVFLSLFINLVFAILIFYKALIHPEIFTGILKTEIIQKYEKSKLSEAEKSEYLSRLKKYFDQEKPFLNPSLTITDVASGIQISSKYISQVINETLQKNFYDFINSYRIEEAKKLLFENKFTGKTVLEILYDSGFNSKSAFNTAFKKHTGITPTSYRNLKISA